MVVEKAELKMNQESRTEDDTVPVYHCISSYFLFIYIYMYILLYIDIHVTTIATMV